MSLPRGQFRITSELLCDALHLPPGTKVVGATAEGDDVSRPAYTVLTVESAGIKPNADGSPPELRPAWSRHQPVQFDGWGQE